MTRLLAIDPGSNKCGIAVFKDRSLSYTSTITTLAKTPLSRRIDIARKINSVLFSDSAEVVSEEPVLLGQNNNGMQRLLGMIEFSIPEVHFIHPMTVKKAVAGSGKAEKIDVALAAGEKLATEGEKEMMADIIAREAWDESDAVAVGLAHLGKNEF